MKRSPLSASADYLPIDCANLPIFVAACSRVCLCGDQRPSAVNTECAMLSCLSAREAGQVVAAAVNAPVVRLSAEPHAMQNLPPPGPPIHAGRLAGIRRIPGATNGERAPRDRRRRAGSNFLRAPCGQWGVRVAPALRRTLRYRFLEQTLCLTFGRRSLCPVH
jgi:hypothetical protein